MTDRSNDPEQISFFSKHILGREGLLILVGVLIILCVCGLLWSTNAIFPPSSDSSELEDFEYEDISPSALAFSPCGVISSFYSLRADDSGKNDIFLVTLSTTSSVTIENVTQSPGISEVYPSVSNDGSMLAYFAVEDNGDTNLFVLYPDGRSRTTAVRRGNSGLGTDYRIDLSHPPIWSTDDTWVAFLGSHTESDREITELFVMPITVRGQIMRLTDSRQTIDSLIWLNDTIIVYIEAYGDGRASLYQLSTLAPTPIPLESSDFRLPQP